MQRPRMILALAALFGAFLLASDAGACCHKRKCATACVPTCAPVACVAPAPPPPPPAPVCEPVACAPQKTCCLKKFRLFGGLCHKRQACVSYAPTCYAPTYYAAPVASGQFIAPSGQGY